jgi:starvation-inducible DNA-binding protein
MGIRHFAACVIGAMAAGGAVLFQNEGEVGKAAAEKGGAPAAEAKPGTPRDWAPLGSDNQNLPQAKLLEQSLPLSGGDDRVKSVRRLQQILFDVPAIQSDYKQAHWNLTGPLYLPLHHYYYDEEAEYYRKAADVLAERVLALGHSVDGRPAAVARQSRLEAFPAGYVTDSGSLRLLIARLTTLQEETYRALRELEDTDPPTRNQLQELAFHIDKNLWQLRAHLMKPAVEGGRLPWADRKGGEPRGAEGAGE